MTTQSKSVDTLIPAGHFTNGVVSNGVTATTLQPLFVAVTYVMDGKGWPPFGALYRGLGANLLGVVPAQTVGFGVNGLIRSWIQEPTELQKAGAAGVAGAAGAVPATVCERIAKLQQLNGGTFRNTAQVIYGTDKARGFFKGLPFVTARDILFSESVFAGKPLMSRLLKEWGMADRFTRDMTAGFSVGAVAGYLSAPAAAIAQRMQTDLRGSYTARDAIYQITRVETEMWLKEDGIRTLITFTTQDWTRLGRGAGVRAGLTGSYVAMLCEVARYLPQFYPSGLHKKSSS
jgi:hypothetical protein